MKISREWLQTYFEKPLPSAEALADALTFHAFEIESVEGDVLDVKVTPNRGHDCLSYRGIAKELSAILDLTLVPYPYGIKSSELEPKNDAVAVVVEDAKRCPRFTACLVRGIKVAPSPEWLQKRLEAMGQRSINNVVDATNYVMFGTGQPLHAFDAVKLAGGKPELTVRAAKSGERMMGLDDKEYALTSEMLVIADSSGEAVSIAGVKGGKPTGVDEGTADIVLEAANWDGPMIRKTSAALKLRTDASERFQQVISPELTPLGLAAAVHLITELAGGMVAGCTDAYPAPAPAPADIRISVKRINAVLGTRFDQKTIADVFRRLAFPSSCQDDILTVKVPFERLDLVPPDGGPEDLIEEVARIVGYDKISAVELPPLDPARSRPAVNANFYAAEKAREELITHGYTEVFTSVFADRGERVVANKVDGVRPYLRATLVDGLKAALERNAHNKELLGLAEVKLFEIGTVWKGGKEAVVLGTADKKGVREEQLKPVEAQEYDTLPLSAAERYRPFSRYPFVVRDIALWVLAGTDAEAVRLAIIESAGELLQRIDKFDEFKKGERTSYAFRLVLQSFDKTLTDEEANAVMEDVYAAVQKRGWEVR